MPALALDLKYRGKLEPATVVTTVMSNMGSTNGVRENNIEHIQAGVGDRNVVMAMRESGAILGGEDSGHVVFLDQHTTGDGLFHHVAFHDASWPIAIKNSLNFAAK